MTPSLSFTVSLLFVGLDPMSVESTCANFEALIFELLAYLFLRVAPAPYNDEILSSEGAVPFSR